MDPKFKDMLDSILKSHSTLNIEEEVKENATSEPPVPPGFSPEKTAAKIFGIASKLLMDIVRFGMREKIPPSAAPMIVGVMLGMIMEGLSKADERADTGYFEAFKGYKGSNLDERTINLVNDFARLTLARIRKDRGDETGGL